MIAGRPIERSHSSGWARSLVLALTLILALAGRAHAQPAVPQNWVPQSVRLHLVSWHDRGGFDNLNLGAALRWRGGLTVGGFNNSLSRPSWYGGIIMPLFESRALQLELMAGAITGYSESSPADLVAVPSVGWHLSARNTLQVVFIPRFVIPANAVHVMFERRL